MRLRSAGRRRESYVGPWLPEPLLTAPDVADDVELAESVSMAMLVVLEALTPVERAVFVLREVFEFGYGEIAEAVDKNEPAVRQIAHRARAHVTAQRPRGISSAAQARDALSAFQQALETGDLQRLLDVLAPDVVFLADGGGVARAAAEPVVGVDRVAAAFRYFASGASHLEFVPTEVNGHPALLLRRGGVVETVVTVRVDEGLVTALYAVRNPAKLSSLERATTVSRGPR